MSIKCNHLVPAYEQNKKCISSDPNIRMHFWIPTGHIEAKINNTIQVDFMCKYCEKRVTNFLEKEDYELNKRLLGA